MELEKNLLFYSLIYVLSWYYSKCNYIQELRF